MVHLIPPTIGNEGLASWYGIEESGRTTASGEIMDPEKLTAAHRTLDFGTLVRVTNLKSRQSVDVIINDRGPFVRGRLIDLSFAAAREINMVNDGVVQVRLKVLGLSGPLSERRWRIQVASFRNLDRAEELANKMRRRGHSPVIVSPFQNNTQNYYRVWVGEYWKRKQAEAYAVEIQNEGYSTIIIQSTISMP